jgi:hypothetical protein
MLCKKTDEQKLGNNHHLLSYLSCVLLQGLALDPGTVQMKTSPFRSGSSDLTSCRLLETWLFKKGNSAGWTARYGFAKAWNIITSRVPHCHVFSSFWGNYVKYKMMPPHEKKKEWAWGLCAVLHHAFSLLLNLHQICSLLQTLCTILQKVTGRLCLSLFILLE